MRLAVISDIHGNLEALEAVLADIRRQGIDDVLCLGDIIGYGPDPCACIDRVMDVCGIVLMGDDDWPALSSEGYSKDGADRARLWTRGQLDPARDRANNVRRRAFLLGRPPTHRAGPYLFVHGSPRNPRGEYVFLEDIYNRRKMERLFSLVERYCFKGHTHVPGLFTDDFRFLPPGEIGEGHALGPGKHMIDVGSVGQPRDGDDRACYVILDDPGGSELPRVRFRRLPYDIDTTLRKIRDRPG